MTCFNPKLKPLTGKKDRGKQESYINISLGACPTPDLHVGIENSISRMLHITSLLITVHVLTSPT
jgi:hypothetical protein